MKKLLSLILALLFCLSFTAIMGCNNGDNSNETADPNVVLMNGFEHFERDIQQIKLLNSFGRVEKNKDKTYVKSGEQSIKLIPKGYNFTNVPPYIVIPTSVLRYDVNYGDFTKVNQVSMWMYNPQETPIEVGIGLLAGPVTTSQWYSSSVNVPGEYFQLKSGWNRLAYDVLPAYLETNSSFSTSAVYGVYVECPYTKTFSLADCPTLYLDDVKLHYGEPSTKQIEFKSDITNGVWEIADFESSYENAYFSIRITGSTNPVYCRPTAKVVQQIKYGIKAENGTGLLEMTLRAGTGDYGWPALTLDGSVLKAAFKNVGQDLIDNPQNYNFEFDLYNCQDFVKSGVTIFMYGKDGETASGYSRGVTANPLSWTKFSINMGYLVGNDADYVTNPGNINFLGSQFATAENTNDRYVLFDNFRIVKADSAV